MKHLLIPYLEYHMVRSSRNRYQIPWVRWRGHASSHSFQWGQTATDKNYSEIGLHDGWSIILPMGNPHKLKCEFVTEMLCCIIPFVQANRSILFLGEGSAEENIWAKAGHTGVKKNNKNILGICSQYWSLLQSFSSVLYDQPCFYNK